ASVAGPLSPAIALPAKNAPAISASATTAAITMRPVQLSSYSSYCTSCVSSATAVLLVSSIARGIAARAEATEAAGRAGRGRPQRARRHRPAGRGLALDDNGVARVDVRRLGLGVAGDRPALGDLDLDRGPVLVLDVQRAAVDARDLADRGA